MIRERARRRWCGDGDKVSPGSKSRKDSHGKLRIRFPHAFRLRTRGRRAGGRASWRRPGPSGCSCTSAAGAPWPAGSSTAWVRRWTLRASSTWSWAACARTPRSRLVREGVRALQGGTASTGCSPWAAARSSTRRRPSPTAPACEGDVWELFETKATRPRRAAHRRGAHHPRRRQRGLEEHGHLQRRAGPQDRATPTTPSVRSSPS